LVSYLDVVIAQRDLLADQQQLAIIQGQRWFRACYWLKALAAVGRISLAAVQVKPKPKDIITP